MKAFMRKLFSPVLNMFESDEDEYIYRESHRTILIVMGLLCLVIAAVSFYMAMAAAEPVGVIPILVFFLTGVVCEIVGLLGSDRAVARIWKRK